MNDGINFYDGSKLLSLKDINKNDPEIYISSGTRSTGKSTFFNRFLMNKFFKYNWKFILLYRFNYELEGVEYKFFNTIKDLYFNDYNMSSKSLCKGIIRELFINEYGKNEKKDFISCGYAISINNADQIKKYSHLLSESRHILFDEFQSESNHYCNREIQKFMSIHMSVSRAPHQPVRRVPVYMVSNYVSLLNPYYVNMGISTNLKSDTNFLRGDGFVLEQNISPQISDLQKKSAFNRAFSSHDYFKSATDNIYLNDNYSFIEKSPSGRYKYIFNFSYKNNTYAIKEYTESGIFYVTSKIDQSRKVNIVINLDDHNYNTVLFSRFNSLIYYLRDVFEYGNFRFNSLLSKEATIRLLSY